ncbi:MAG: Cu+-exporting ATPase [bacterium]
MNTDHSADLTCSHCLQPTPKSIAIFENQSSSEGLIFCCNGCQGIYHLIHEAGLKSFYQKRTGDDFSSSTESGGVTNQESYELESFKQRYIREKEEFHEISLVIIGIHCAACVWLNEKILTKLEGVQEVSINFSTHKAKVLWNPNQVSLATIIGTIRNIGYSAHPYNPLLKETFLKDQRSKEYTRILVALFCSMNIMWLAVGQYAGYFSGMEQRFKDLFHFLEFLLTTPVLFYCAKPFFLGAWTGIKQRILNMDFQVAFSTSLIYGYSIYMAITRKGDSYFEAVAMFITFILGGKFLETLSIKKINDVTDSLASLIPSEARMIDDSGERKFISVESIEKGMVLEVLPGEKIVVDGIVLSGNSYVDESYLNGEPLPILKKEGSSVYGVSINQDGVIQYKSKQELSDSSLSKIIHLMDDALAGKPKIQQFADFISKYFIIGILTIAGLTFAGWFAFDKSLESALMNAISVLIIACPCALGLATPMAGLTGLSVSAKRKILFKKASHMEVMSKITDIILDKTGTITEGKPTVTSAWFKQENSDLLHSFLVNSRHPISKAVYTYLQNEHVLQHQLEVEFFQNVSGKGIQAKFQGKDVYGGSLEFIRKQGIEFTEEQQKYLEKIHQDQPSLFIFAINKQVEGIFAIEDSIKESSVQAIQALQKKGLSVHMLTGDHQTAAEKIAHLCNIPLQNVHAGVDPIQKEEFVQKLQKIGCSVVMVGDGINDTLALARADIGIAMGSGMDTAIEVSDVLILNNELKSVEQAHQIAVRTLALTKQNLAISLLYNVFAIPLAVFGWVIPLIAAGSMSLSSLLVVGNSIRIKSGFKNT